ncbi:hypothetical protein BDZ90DRAFT_276695 [Jaminaea rosea]|uniref:Uncharacterized protein n=1 Tax=Jaminaea rosea TaxID=1569628 RepID=A0A316UYZ1_9BASI|nr:hypothetical protein BDZ90DRAFT_276695 [Jaminaea rosea]PWN30214.1 hypothetical protein BDZ90DRAFT_276695 [Jaminaea rosea]
MIRELPEGWALGLAHWAVWFMPEALQVVVIHLVMPLYEAAGFASSLAVTRSTTDSWSAEFRLLTQHALDTLRDIEWRPFAVSLAWTAASSLAYMRIGSPSERLSSSVGTSLTRVLAIAAVAAASGVTVAIREAARVPAELELRRRAVAAVPSSRRTAARAARRGPGETPFEHHNDAAYDAFASRATAATIIPAVAASRQPASWLDPTLRTYLKHIMGLRLLSLLLDQVSLSAWSTCFGVFTPAYGVQSPPCLFSLHGRADEDDVTTSRGVAWALTRAVSKDRPLQFQGKEVTSGLAAILFEDLRCCSVAVAGRGHARFLRLLTAGAAGCVAALTAMQSDVLVMLRSRALLRWAVATQPAMMVEALPGQGRSDGMRADDDATQPLLVISDDDEEAGQEEEEERVVTDSTMSLRQTASMSNALGLETREQQAASNQDFEDASFLLEPPSFASATPSTTASPLQYPPEDIAERNDLENVDFWTHSIDLLAMPRSSSGADVLRYPVQARLDSSARRQDAAPFNAALRVRLGPEERFEDDFAGSETESETEEVASVATEEEEDVSWRTASSPSTASTRRTPPSRHSAYTTPSTRGDQADVGAFDLHLDLPTMDMGEAETQNVPAEQPHAAASNLNEQQAWAPGALERTAHLLLSARARELAYEAALRRFEALPPLPESLQQFVPAPPLLPAVFADEEQEAVAAEEGRPTASWARVLFSDSARSMRELLSEMRSEEGTTAARRALVFARIVRTLTHVALERQTI